jgi:hypothetical protein
METPSLRADSMSLLKVNMRAYDFNATGDRMGESARLRRRRFSTNIVFQNPMKKSPSQSESCFFAFISKKKGSKLSQKRTTIGQSSVMSELFGFSKNQTTRLSRSSIQHRSINLILLYTVSTLAACFGILVIFNSSSISTQLWKSTKSFKPNTSHMTDDCPIVVLFCESLDLNVKMGLFTWCLGFLDVLFILPTSHIPGWQTIIDAQCSLMKSSKSFFPLV